METRTCLKMETTTELPDPRVLRPFAIVARVACPDTRERRAISEFTHTLRLLRVRCHPFTLLCLFSPILLGFDRLCSYANAYDMSI